MEMTINCFNNFIPFQPEVMLNISETKVGPYIDQASFSSLTKVESRRSGRVLLRLFILLTFLALVIMFLQWTQNIRARGNVTALRPDQRPQTIQSIITGRI